MSIWSYAPSQIIICSAFDCQIMFLGSARFSNMHRLSRFLSLATLQNQNTCHGAFQSAMISTIVSNPPDSKEEEYSPRPSFFSFVRLSSQLDIDPNESELRKSVKRLLLQRSRTAVCDQIKELIANSSQEELNTLLVEDLTNLIEANGSTNADSNFSQLNETDEPNSKEVEKTVTITKKTPLILLLLQHAQKESRSAVVDILDLLSRKRIQDLTIEAKASFITELQISGSLSKAEEELAVVDLILQTKGEDLTKLKNLVDTGPGPFGLRRLIFEDITTEELRYDLLQHFALEASRLGDGVERIKLLSDIDDTIYASWIDRRYPLRTVYPGAKHFYKLLSAPLDTYISSQNHVIDGVDCQTDKPTSSLDFQEVSLQLQAESDTNDIDLKGTSDNRECISESGRSHDVVFLTARPRGWRGVVVKKTRQEMSAHGIDSESGMLTGTWRNVLGNKNIAKKKFQNFQQYRVLFPEYGFIFNGDSGQGDALVGFMMLTRYPNSVRAVLIHDVKLGSVTGDGGSKSDYIDNGVFFYQNYVAAVCHLYKKNLISQRGVHIVSQAAIRELLAINFRRTIPGIRGRQSRFVELNRDLGMANELLPEELKLVIPQEIQNEVNEYLVSENAQTLGVMYSWGEPEPLSPEIEEDLREKRKERQHLRREARRRRRSRSTSEAAYETSHLSQEGDERWSQSSEERVQLEQEREEEEQNAAQSPLWSFVLSQNRFETVGSDSNQEKGSTKTKFWPWTRKKIV